jgi:hypothetical protein
MENQHIHLDKDNNTIMEINLLNGMFSKNEALDLISQMIQLKIKFHENKISHSSREEDIKSRESKIKFLHSELHGLRSFLESTNKDVSLYSKVEVK